MGIGPAARASAVLEIDVAGIVANWRYLAGKVAPAGCAAVVKADGYGLGASVVAGSLAAAGCRRFFVATLDEALALRETLPEQNEIAVLNGPVSGSAEEFAEAALVPVLNDPGQIAEWRQARGAARAVAGDAAYRHRDGPPRLDGARVRRARRRFRPTRGDPLAWVVEPSRLRRRAGSPAEPRPARAVRIGATPFERCAGEPGGVFRDLSGRRLPFRFCPAGGGALRRQPAAGPAQPDAPNCPAQRRKSCKSARLTPVSRLATVRRTSRPRQAVWRRWRSDTRMGGCAR